MRSNSVESATLLNVARPKCRRSARWYLAVLSHLALLLNCMLRYCRCVHFLLAALLLAFLRLSSHWTSILKRVMRSLRNGVFSMLDLSFRCIRRWAHLSLLYYAALVTSEIINFENSTEMSRLQVPACVSGSIDRCVLNYLYSCRRGECAR